MPAHSKFQFVGTFILGYLLILSSANNCQLPEFNAVRLLPKPIKIKRDADETFQSPSVTITTFKGQNTEVEFVVGLQPGIPLSKSPNGMIRVDRDGQTLPVSTICITGQKFRGIAISFRDIKKQHEGNYTFTLNYNHTKTALSYPTKLVVQSKPKIHKLRVPFGTPFNLNCSTNSDSSFWIFKNGSRLRQIGRELKLLATNQSDEYQCGMLGFPRKRFIYDIFKIEVTESLNNKDSNFTTATSAVFATVLVPTASSTEMFSKIATIQLPSSFHPPTEIYPDRSATSNLIIIATVSSIGLVIAVVLVVLILLWKKKAASMYSDICSSCGTGVRRSQQLRGERTVSSGNFDKGDSQFCAGSKPMYGNLAASMIELEDTIADGHPSNCGCSSTCSTSPTFNETSV